MLFRPRKNDGVDARERSLWGDLLALGMVFPIAIVLGWFLGQWIGGMFGYPETGRLIGLAWGILTGFWELFKVTKRLDRYDKLVNPGAGEDVGADSESRSVNSDCDSEDKDIK